MRSLANRYKPNSEFRCNEIRGNESNESGMKAQVNVTFVFFGEWSGLSSAKIPQIVSTTPKLQIDIINQ